MLRAVTGLRSVKRGISTVHVKDIETRWNKLPECEQGAIADYLLAKERGDWKKLSLEEQRAAYFIAYGPHASRTPNDPSIGPRVFQWTAFFFVLSVGCWQTWNATMKPTLRTKTPEWKAAELERQHEKMANPYSNNRSVE